METQVLQPKILSIFENEKEMKKALFKDGFCNGAIENTGEIFSIVTDPLGYSAILYSKGEPTEELTFPSGVVEKAGRGIYVGFDEETRFYANVSLTDDDLLLISFPRVEMIELSKNAKPYPKPAALPLNVSSDSVKASDERFATIWFGGAIIVFGIIIFLNSGCL